MPNTPMVFPSDGMLEALDRYDRITKQMCSQPPMASMPSGSKRSVSLSSRLSPLLLSGVVSYFSLW